jgi:chorismate dehydratase
LRNVFASYRTAVPHPNPTKIILVPLRVAAISFLNPAPLLFNFEHDPAASTLRSQYELHYTTPAHCARELHSGSADLGLIPIAELTPELAIVPGCTIASLREVRSILLLVKNPANLPVGEALSHVTTIATDSASRSSTAYAHILFEHFYNTRPTFTEQRADAVSMLSASDAALLIGDPALLARQNRTQIEAEIASQFDADFDPDSLLWLDLAALWRQHTGLPWVAAVWAVRPAALRLNGITPARLTADLIASRDAGLTNIDTLVREWTPRIPIPADIIRTYLTQNIHYTLDSDCLRAIEHFRALGVQLGALPPLPLLNLLG